MRVAIIGGGAAGFFAALSVREHHPRATVHILEKSKKCLSKVKASGGGRCNVTHDCAYTSDLIKNYPRGKSLLKKLFKVFSHKDTVRWFAERRVELKIEQDGRMFPTTDDSQTIIDCFLRACDDAGIEIKTSSNITQIEPKDHSWQLHTKTSKLQYDKVIIATGGHPKESSYDWLKNLGHEIVPPVPSLFTFNMPQEPIKKLMGVVAPAARVKIIGCSQESSGPLLITHWGMSGPAILVLSAWAARELAAQQYAFDIAVQWCEEMNEDQVRAALADAGNAKVKNLNFHQLPSRLWEYLLQKSEINPEINWRDQSKKAKNKLIRCLTHDVYSVSGKTTFKEEFVTCGGVSLDSIHHKTLESKSCKGLYFAGELLDIDAVTGGFNFQAAWTTGYIAGQLR